MARSDGQTPVAFGVKKFAQAQGQEVLRIAVHADETEEGEDYSWVLYHGCDHHPENPTWEDKASVPPSGALIYMPLEESSGDLLDWTENGNDATRDKGVTPLFAGSQCQRTSAWLLTTKLPAEVRRSCHENQPGQSEEG